MRRATWLLLCCVLAAPLPAVELQPPQETAAAIRARFAAYLRERHLDVAHYVLQSLRYDYVSGDWSAFYLGKGNAFDDSFQLWLPAGGQVEFVP